MREPFCKARIYVTTLLVTEVILGLMIIVVTIIYHRILGGYLGEMECRLLGGQLFNTYLLGTQLLVTYFCSLFMWKRLWKRKCTPNVQLLLHLWVFFCFMIVVCGFGTIWSLFTCADALESLAESSLLKGIDMYYTCPEWKLLWDGLQYHKECCGVHSYKDWMKAAWMPQETQTQTQGTCPVVPDKDTVLAPYACCKHECSSCYENYVPHAGTSGEIPTLNLSQINTCGCLPIFTYNMWKILYTLFGLILVSFKLDIILCCLTKYIVRKQNRDECEGSDNFQYAEDDQNLVVVKCPPNVRCLLLDDDEDVSNADGADGADKLPDINISQMIEAQHQCQICRDAQRAGLIKADVMKIPSKRRHSRHCGCNAKASDSRILH